MTNDEPQAAGQDLQFDRVVTDSTAPGGVDQPGVICAACRTALDTEYFDINGGTFCAQCRIAVEADALVPTGIRPLATAGLFGIGAGVTGAAIYYAVMAIANLEIGIVAILIGYMVGRAVRKGAGGRGGRRFQVLAVALTYGSVALAYTPIAVRGLSGAQGGAQTTTTASPSQSGTTARADDSLTTTGPPTVSRFLFYLLLLCGFIAALPVLVVVGSLPFGLISALIIFIGMHQAWKMTGAPTLQIQGPFRVGTAPLSTSP